MVQQVKVAPRNADRTVVSVGDSFYLLTEVLDLSKRVRIEHVEAKLLDLESSRAVPSMPAQELDAVVYTKFGGSLVVLAGKELVRGASDKGIPKVPGRFVSAYALKQAKR